MDAAAEARAVSRRRALRVLFWVFSIVVFLFVAGAFFLPSEITVTRTVTTNAPAGRIFEQLESFRKWQAWAPWFQRDPMLMTDFTGPESGEGAMMSWSSKKEGDGRIKIVSVNRPFTQKMAVDFGDSGDAEMWFKLHDPGPGPKELTWTFKVDFGQNMARRYFGLLLRGAIERDLDEGLANLKALLEKPAAAAP